MAQMDYRIDTWSLEVKKNNIIVRSENVAQMHNDYLMYQEKPLSFIVIEIMKKEIDKLNDGCIVAIPI